MRLLCDLHFHVCCIFLSSLWFWNFCLSLTKLCFKENHTHKKKYAHTKTGDDNEIHSNDNAAQKLGFERAIAHGMFTASLFATAVGKNLPGAILVSKELKWKLPVFVDENIKAKVEVIEIIKQKKIVICEMNAINDKNNTVVSGKVTLLIRNLKT